jgi:hypothetical protein
MATATTLEKFNVTFNEFINDLIQTFPDDMEFKMYHIGLTSILKNSPTLILDVFQKQVVDPYESYIMNKNDQFFLNHEYNDLKESGGASVSLVINKIKNYYTNMSQNDKDIIMKYMMVLTRLCKVYSKEIMI